MQEKLVGWGEVASASEQSSMETWGVKVTTTTTGVGQEGVEMSRLDQDTNKMLKKDIEIEKVVRLPEGRKDERRSSSSIPRERLQKKKVKSCKEPTEASSSGYRRRRGKLQRRILLSSWSKWRWMWNLWRSTSWTSRRGWTG